MLGAARLPRYLISQGSLPHEYVEMIKRHALEKTRATIEILRDQQQKAGSLADFYEKSTRDVLEKVGHADQVGEAERLLVSLTTQYRASEKRRLEALYNKEITRQPKDDIGYTNLLVKDLDLYRIPRRNNPRSRSRSKSRNRSKSQRVSVATKRPLSTEARPNKPPKRSGGTVSSPRTSATYKPPNNNNSRRGKPSPRRDFVPRGYQQGNQRFTSNSRRPQNQQQDFNRRPDGNRNASPRYYGQQGPRQNYRDGNRGPRRQASPPPPPPHRQYQPPRGLSAQARNLLDALSELGEQYSR